MVDIKIDWEFFRRPAHLINRAARLLGRVGESRLRPLGFGAGQLPVLSTLKNGNALSQKDLVRIVQIEQPSMAQLLARMERDGIIERITDPSDRRSSLIRLTESAEARLPEARAILFQGNDEALRGFTDEERETLSRLLLRVIDNLEEMVKGSSGE